MVGWFTHFPIDFQDDIGTLISTFVQVSTSVPRTDLHEKVLVNGVILPDERAFSGMFIVVTRSVSRYNVQDGWAIYDSEDEARSDGTCAVTFCSSGYIGHALIFLMN